MKQASKRTDDRSGAKIGTSEKSLEDSGADSGTKLHLAAGIISGLPFAFFVIASVPRHFPTPTPLSRPHLIRKREAGSSLKTKPASHRPRQAYCFQTPALPLLPALDT